MQFCLDFHHEAGLRQLLLPPLLLRLEPGDLLGLRVAPLPATRSLSPVRAPASRDLRQSMMWLEYEPSRRSTAPFSPSGAASYSATISSLYWAVNERRLARSGTSGFGRAVPSTRPGSSDPVARSNGLTFIVISENLHPRPRVSNCQLAGASPEVAREGSRSRSRWCGSVCVRRRFAPSRRRGLSG